MTDDHRYWNIARSDYKSILTTAALSQGAKFEFGADLQHIDLATTYVTCVDGRNFQADLIIGADGMSCANVSSKILTTPGINSKTRSFVPELAATKVTHWKEHTYKCTIDKELINRDAELSALLKEARTDGTSYMMPDKYVVLWPLREGLPCEVLASATETAPEEPGNFLSDDKYVAEVKEKFEQFCPQVTKMIGLTQNVTKWSIGELPELQIWRSANGNVLLIGDAAHAMIPHAAMGATSSVEDGAVLATVLTWASRHGKTVKDATAAFEMIRKPRASKLQQLSRAQDGFLGASGDAAVHRNAMLKELDRQLWESLKIPEDERRSVPRPPVDPDAPYPAQWMYGHDAVRTVSARSKLFAYLHNRRC